MKAAKETADKRGEALKRAADVRLRIAGEKANEAFHMKAAKERAQSAMREGFCLISEPKRKGSTTAATPSQPASQPASQSVSQPASQLVAQGLACGGRSGKLRLEAIMRCLAECVEKV